METNILQGVQRLINTAFLHQKTFSEFKNKFYGKKVVLVGAGPTLNYFEPIEDAIYVGVNRTFLNEKIKFDYLFTIDRAGLETVDKNYYKEFFSYREDDCIKFVGDQNLGIYFQIPESVIVGRNIRRYKTTAGICSDKFTLDIESEPLGNFTSVGLQAIQFIMYGNPKEVYLVGFDCNAAKAGHFTGGKNIAFFRGEDLDNTNDLAIWGWKEFKKFRDLYYPNTNIISINPVELKNVFDKDIYTENYKYSEDRRRYEKHFSSDYSEYKNFLENINFKNRYKELCRQYKGKIILLYGAGKLLSYIKQIYDFSELNIVGISDKKFTRYDKSCLGFNVVQIKDIKNIKSDVIITSLLKDKEIVESLKDDLLKDSNIELVSLLHSKEDLERI